MLCSIYNRNALITFNLLSWFSCLFALPSHAFFQYLNSTDALDTLGQLASSDHTLLGCKEIKQKIHYDSDNIFRMKNSFNFSAWQNFSKYELPNLVIFLIPYIWYKQTHGGDRSVLYLPFDGRTHNGQKCCFNHCYPSKNPRIKKRKACVSLITFVHLSIISALGSSENWHYFVTTIQIKVHTLSTDGAVLIFILLLGQNERC